MEDVLRRALSEVSREESSDYMAELLMDDTQTTWKLFEYLAGSWLDGNEDYRNGLNDAVIYITGWSLDTIAKRLLEGDEDE